ncbi:MAG: alpha/beta fold hydrolase [Pseudomonadota bacterium]|nr:alpha/beta fold hydrolase [Pseudomonadota bacterium]
MTNPEIGKSIVAAGIKTNYHDVGEGYPVILVHGSGPGVTAYANWRLNIPYLSQFYRVIAPDMVGFGYTEQPEGYEFSLDNWVQHIIGVMDALDIQKAHIVGNSFGGGLAIATALRYPERVGRLVLMGAAGTKFKLTEGLDAVWGYQPSIENMRKLLDLFAYDRSLVSDELAEVRYKASIRPGVQESFASMFPAPRQRWIDSLASSDEELKSLSNETLIIHGREDRVVPLSSSLHLAEVIDRAQLHVFGRCGHWTQIEHTDRFNRLVVDFFNEINE